MPSYYHHNSHIFDLLSLQDSINIQESHGKSECSMKSQFTLFNSSLIINDASFCQNSFSSTFKLKLASNLCLHSCRVLSNNDCIASQVSSWGGYVELFNFSIASHTHVIQHPLTMNCEESSLFMLQCKDCTFNSLTNIHVSSFLATGHVTFFVADGCSFLNISHSPSLPHRFTSHATPSIWNSCLIQNSKFYSCPNAQFGVVVTPTQNLMMIMNTSFSHSSDTHSPTNGSINSYSSGDVVAYSVHFSNLKDSNRIGLAFLINGNATLNASFCLFEMINASKNANTVYGAAVNHEGDGVHYSNKCNYTNCSSGYAAGGLSARSSSLEVVTSCSFDKCVAQFYSGLFFYSDIGDHLFEMNTFMKCVATYHTAGIGICFSSKNLRISECLIILCNSSTVHGAVSFVWERESISGIIAKLDFCFFEKNTIGNTSYGCDVSTDSSYYNSKVTKESFVHSYSLSACPIRVMIDTVDHSDWLGRPPSTIPVVFVSSVFGNDSRSECGFGGLPCKTIEKGISKRVRSQPLVISEGSYIHGTIPVDEMNVSLRGCEFEESTLTSNAVGDGKALFSVSSGILSVSYFTVVHTSSNSNPQSSVLMMSGSGRVTIQFSTIKGEASPATTFSTPLMIVNGGLAELASVCFTAFSNEKQLISFSSPNYLKMSDVTFNTITRQSGNGAIFEAQLLDGNEFCLSNVSFADCLCLRGNGGGMQIHMERGSSFSIGNASDKGATAKMNNCKAIGSLVSPGCGGGLLIKLDKDADNFLLKQLAFEGCIADRGYNLFVDAWQLDKLINATTLEFGPGRNDLDGYAGYERSTAGETLSIPLVVYLWDNMSVFAHVGGEKSADFSRCGYSEFPCSSIMSAVSLWFKGSNRFVELHSPFSLRSELLLDAFEWTIMSRVGKVTIGLDECNFSGGQAGMIETVSKSALTNFSFALPKSIGFKEALIVCKSSSLSVKECDVAIKQESTNISFLSARGGQVSINQLIMRSTFFDGTSTLDAIFVTDACESFMLNDSIIENSQIRDGSVVKISDCTANVNVSNCTFKEVTCSLGKGGAISMHKPEVALPCYECLEKCTFEECKIKSDEACGGGVCCCIGMNNHLEITNCAFAACEASVKKKGGFGGGLFLEFDHQGVEFVVSEPSFSQSSPNAAKCGSDLFMKSPSLEASVTDSTLPFAKTMADISLNSMRGFDGNDSEHAIPLILLFQSTGSEILASSLEGADTIACGFECYPCASIDQALSRFKTVDKRVITVRTGSFVIHEIDLSDVKMISEGEQQATLTMSSAIENGTTMISSKGITQLEQLKIIVPPHISNEVKVVISSSTNQGVLSLTNCQIEIEDESEVPNNYVVIKTSGSSIHLVFVSVTNCRMAMPLFSFDIVPPMNAPETAEVQMKNCSFSNITHQDKDSSALFGASLGCGCSIAGCNFSEIFADQSMNGGAMRVVLEAHGELEITDCNTNECQAENRTEGKGGWLFFECTEAYATEQFLFNSTVFSMNVAKIGKNIFVLSASLNSSITTQAFSFNYSGLINDSNVFVGSDDIFTDTDLFRFLIPYANNTIFVSSSGADVLRCGSEDDPCESFWTGVNHLSHTDDGKQIFIEGVANVDNEYDLSGFVVASASILKEEDCQSEIVFSKKMNGTSGAYVLNRNEMSICAIMLSIGENFENSADCVILSEGDELLLRRCAFQSKAADNTEADCSFVLMRRGKLSVDDLEMKSSSVRKSVFVMHDACVCEFHAVKISQCTIDRGCVFESVSSTNAANGIGLINMTDSALSSAKRNDNGGSAIHSTGQNGLIILISGSQFVDCKAEMSMKGGAVSFCLNDGGELRISDTTMTRCSCSMSGRGGGIHVSTKVEGALNILFQKMFFTGNTAGVGNDIFILCHNITKQINETQFRFSLKEGVYSSINAIYGSDTTDHMSDTNLMDFITIYESDFIIVSSDDGKNGKNERQCGSAKIPCFSIGYACFHLSSDITSMMLVDGESVIDEECILDNMTLTSLKRNDAAIRVQTGISQAGESLITIQNHVTLSRLSFVFERNALASHSSFIFMSSDSLRMESCSFTSPRTGQSQLSIPCTLFTVLSGDVYFSECAFSGLHLASSAISSCTGNVKVTSCSFKSIDYSASVITCDDGMLEICNTSFDGCFEKDHGAPLISFTNAKNVSLKECNIVGSHSSAMKGGFVSFTSCTNICISSCLFENTDLSNREENNINSQSSELCSWNSSLASLERSTASISDTLFSNASHGGLSASGGSVRIVKGEFVGNDPSIARFPSIRRNILCEHNGKLEIDSLKGGDGLLPNTSLWILNEGCELTGIPTGRLSEFFIPSLDAVEVKENGDAAELTFKGKLLIPCNLSFQIVSKRDDVSSIETFPFSEDGFDSENEAKGKISMSLISSAAREEEVLVCILFGRGKVFSSTDSFILKNKSESQTSGDERIVEGRNKEKSIWPIVVVILAVILLIILTALVIFVVRWKKQKKRTEELEVIVNDNVRKDPKAFEMVTMEMSPEEQWRRAEREAEKKNEEKMKKRVYAKSLQHSESSEHLLAESGSTEYILGKDSDKIPEWALEKDEEEEIRKQTPSPSISSTCSTDSDSTFVRGEDLCPTTSSMSNLVDAIACSSPHEKLIVDLRDSLFMLLHGKNKTKEMAIGTLQEREMTAAQILFWVANLALHSFDEMENKLQSLNNLSPHIVLFSEHMVICIVMHSDLLSDDDSDSSSISSSTVVTSASDDDDDDSLPSSAFEDEDSFKKECLRWKAPELLINKNMGATKKSVVFSIGMMLWECLTLHIPFGEYEAVIAGDKIAKGEALSMCGNTPSTFSLVVSECLSFQPSNRPSLVSISREFFQKFPESAKLPTMTDALFTNQQSAISRNSCCSY
ncbi:uncharacterized protein MONOS_4161 [Monocercomonoides exilis]|uniref:uncharacterized protein n=1 Tax=Monocercomonoides exilis TaxID=2049356 RepID=UPI00355AB043|nr:hypothetical protein MONOS_4161 [Monocercomonoides exilis]|eukprot:MONOS_4161.1-p1 / transcript=MONOS_4161.1 / gene=MONOS_4161 / organism=Monocercomonoides_exilis_PA203 / gene_product=unspecified product / transcript_product=unspecified product / location=Mono_scaffold00106:114287-122887(+) / protein_length=2866 / sequence_SO=supercontig / SO=protein_coding / is_pseudo=false